VYIGCNQKHNQLISTSNMPSKPTPTDPRPDCDDPANPPRRSFLGGLLAAGAAGVGALLALPVVKFVLHPLLAQTTEKSWSDVGSMDEFQSLNTPVKKLVQIEQLDGWRRTVSQMPVYVVRDSAGQIAVLSAVCTHLGCSLPWVDDQKSFICPCHKGTFDPSGKLISGPPPRSMDALPTKVEDGVVKIRYQFFRQLSPDKEVVA
jgi:menaquinol-cytochrome c reductase iron-sulfur subunit